MIVIKATLFFIMDYEVLHSWEQEIEAANISNNKKLALKRYVYDILDQNGVVIIDVEHLSLLLGLDKDVVCRMINAPETFYREFKIKKRNGGERLITAPYPSLMFVQQWIYKNILMQTTIIQPQAKGFVPGLSILDNATPHLQHPQVLKMDIKDFFPSISINRIIRVFKKLGYHHKLAYALAALCCHHSCLPQGAPTSPILSNIVMRHIDRRLEGLSRRYNITYTRYADDLTFSGEHISVKFIEYIQSIIVDGGFSVNQSKTKLLKNNVKKIITGVSISSGKPTIPKTLKRRLRQEAFYIHKYGYKQHAKHCRHIVDPAYKLRLMGKFSYWNSIERDNDKVKGLVKQLKIDIKKHKRRFWL